MENVTIQIVMRYVHIVSAILLVGAMAAMIMALKSAAQTLTQDQCREFSKCLGRRFARLAYICFAGLMVSGTYNWMRLAGDYKELGPKGNAVIGTKVLLVLIILVVTIAHSLRLIRLSGRACHLINLHLAAIIVFLAVLLRSWRGG